MSIGDCSLPNLQGAYAGSRSPQWSAPAEPSYVQCVFHWALAPGEMMMAASTSRARVVISHALFTCHLGSLDRSATAVHAPLNTPGQSCRKQRAFANCDFRKRKAECKCLPGLHLGSA